MLPDWIELCVSLNDKQVEYLLVGGQAVIAHGYPRMTKDLDLWVHGTEENGRRVLDALQAFGTPVPLEADAFANPRTLLMIGREPFRVDILTAIPGVSFAAAWLNRTSVRLDGVDIPLISKAELIANKKAVARPQDLADVAALEALDRL